MTAGHGAVVRLVEGGGHVDSGCNVPAAFRDVGGVDGACLNLHRGSGYIKREFAADLGRKTQIRNQPRMGFNFCRFAPNRSSELALRKSYVLLRRGWSARKPASHPNMQETRVLGAPASRRFFRSICKIRGKLFLICVIREMCGEACSCRVRQLRRTVNSERNPRGLKPGNIVGK